MAHLQQLDAGHQRFLSGHSEHPHATGERLRNLVEGQHPFAAILSCADSRVPVELLFDAGFGDLFVVRNAGNTCTSATIASLEYAIQALDISLVLVMGHEGCGAVTAACAARHLVRCSALMRGQIDAGRLLLEVAYYTLRSGEIEWLGGLDAHERLHPAEIGRAHV